MSRKFTMLIALIAILLVGGYFGSPYYAAKQFKDAAMSADADRLDEAVDFPAVRENLKSQLSAAMMAHLQDDPSMKNNPFAGLGAMMAPVIVDKVVNAYVTPEGISALVKGKKPNDAQATGMNPDIAFKYEWVSLDRFRVNTSNVKTNEAGPSVLFERRGIFSWELIRFTLPSTLFDKKPQVAPASATVEPAAPIEPGPEPTAEATPSPIAMPDPVVSEVESVEQLKAHWQALNEECRGSSHAPEDAVCTGRDDAEGILKKRGICWAYSDIEVTPVNYEWHPCSEERPR